MVQAHPGTACFFVWFASQVVFKLFCRSAGTTRKLKMHSKPETRIRIGRRIEEMKQLRMSSRQQMMQWQSSTHICIFSYMMKKAYQEGVNAAVLGSIVVSILACHARDRGSIPRRGVFLSSNVIMITYGHRKNIRLDFIYLHPTDSARFIILVYNSSHLYLKQNLI